MEARKGPDEKRVGKGCIVDGLKLPGHGEGKARGKLSSAQTVARQHHSMILKDKREIN